MHYAFDVTHTFGSDLSAKSAHFKKNVTTSDNLIRSQPRKFYAMWETLGWTRFVSKSASLTKNDTGVQKALQSLTNDKVR